MVRVYNHAGTEENMVSVDNLLVWGGLLRLAPASVGGLLRLAPLVSTLSPILGLYNKGLMV